MGFSTTVLHMRWIITLTLLVGCAGVAPAHHPERKHQRVHPYYDLIGPLGNQLPPSYRRTYNRPTNLGGKIAYWIAPSSQEAMAWHDATHRCAYKNNRPRIEKHYFYPKPWESLRIGARPRTTTAVETAMDGLQPYPASETTELEPVSVEPLSADGALIEE